MRETPRRREPGACVAVGILGWAEKVGIRPDGSNPCRHVERYPEKAVERLLTAAELARLGDALERATQPWTDESRVAWRQECERQAEALGLPKAERAAWVESRMPRRDTAEDWRAIAALRLLIFTGARESEILTLRWEWIAAVQGAARLPDSKTGAKNLYLSPRCVGRAGRSAPHGGQSACAAGRSKSGIAPRTPSMWRRPIADISRCQRHDLCWPQAEWGLSATSMPEPPFTFTPHSGSTSIGGSHAL